MASEEYLIFIGMTNPPVKFNHIIENLPSTFFRLINLLKENTDLENPANRSIQLSQSSWNKSFVYPAQGERDLPDSRSPAHTHV